MSETDNNIFFFLPSFGIIYVRAHEKSPVCKDG